MDKNIIDHFIKNAIAEDIGDGDHTSLSTIPEGTKGKARLIVKEDGVLAGVELAVEIFNQIDTTLEVTVLLKDGAVSASAIKGVSAARINTSATNNTVVFSNGASDYELAAAVETEFAAIKAQFEVVAPEAPTEG